MTRRTGVWRVVASTARGQLGVACALLFALGLLALGCESQATSPSQKNEGAGGTAPPPAGAGGDASDDQGSVGGSPDGEGGAAWSAPECSVEPYDAIVEARPPAWDEGEGCPPGPIFTLVGRPCEDFPADCWYPAPRYTGASVRTLNATELSCEGGRIVGRQTLICCDGPDFLEPCPSAAEEGALCTTDEVGECYRPGPNASPEHGFVDGQICACDPPGPKWRCATLCQTCGTSPSSPQGDGLVVDFSLIVHLGDVEYVFGDAVAVAHGEVSAEAPFFVGLGLAPTGGPIGGYDNCIFALERAPLSEIEILTEDEAPGYPLPDHRPVSFTLTLGAEVARTLFQANLDELAREPNTQRDETWDDWLETLELRDVEIRVSAEHYDLVEFRSCD